MRKIWLFLEIITKVGVVFDESVKTAVRENPLTIRKPIQILF